MAKWVVADSLYCPEAFFCSHLDSYSHYLREFGETVAIGDVSNVATWRGSGDGIRALGAPDVLFALDKYDVLSDCPASIKVAQVAAACPVMPWDVRKPDGSPAYDLIISSIPWMVEAARAAGCRAEYQPLAFDTRARVCGMGVTRDLGCIFIGTTGPNHKRRTELLAELSDVVTVLPPVFGREYFKTLARAKVVLNVHAEWSRGAANNMRMFEAAGMGCCVVGDGDDPTRDEGYYYLPAGLPFATALEARRQIRRAYDDAECDEDRVIVHHTYENRIPQLVDFVRSLGGA